MKHNRIFILVAGLAAALVIMLVLTADRNVLSVSAPSQLIPPALRKIPKDSFNSFVHYSTRISASQSKPK